MADKEIGDLTSGGAAASGDVVHVFRTPNSRKATLGDAAGKNTGTGAGTVAAGDDSRITGAIQASLLTTRGDIIYRDASMPARLAKGTQYQVLQAGANDPLYAALNLGQAAAVTGVLPAANLPDASTSAEGVSEFATAAEFRTGTDTARSLVVDQVWSAAQSAGLTDSATVTVNLASFLTLAQVVLGGNRTLDFTNLKEGQHFILMVTATGSTRTLTMDAIADLWDGVETGPYSITTSQTLWVCGFVPDGAASVEITAIGRRAT